MGRQQFLGCVWVYLIEQSFLRALFLLLGAKFPFEKREKMDHFFQQHFQPISYHSSRQQLLSTQSKMLDTIILSCCRPNHQSNIHTISPSHFFSFAHPKLFLPALDNNRHGNIHHTLHKLYSFSYIT